MRGQSIEKTERQTAEPAGEGDRGAEQPGRGARASTAQPREQRRACAPARACAQASADPGGDTRRRCQATLRAVETPVAHGAGATAAGRQRTPYRADGNPRQSPPGARPRGYAADAADAAAPGLAGLPVDERCGRPSQHDPFFPADRTHQSRVGDVLRPAWADDPASHVAACRLPNSGRPVEATTRDSGRGVQRLAEAGRAFVGAAAATQLTLQSPRPVRGRPQ